ncbi:MAG: hypothetical protein JWQ11_30 [Rhizobacter sp.]|nr:hypothetical protein [Rhizobacter sp.]
MPTSKPPKKAVKTAVTSTPPAPPRKKKAATKKVAAKKVAAKQSRAASKRTPRSHHYSVYVVLLDDAVWNSARFRKANPDHVLGQPHVYVGMTGLDPDVRFDKHKAGIQANRFVAEHGLRLLPHLYDVFNPMPYAGAADMEVELGISLRERGFGVWQG